MEEEPDTLGLDQPLKLGRVSRIPKLTDELIFENYRGLPQVRNNYTKLTKSIKRNDRNLAKSIEKQGRGASKSVIKQKRVDSETANLQKVLSFYQLWCHGLFPRANFKDCLAMLRNHKSFALKEYRRGLLNNEIRRLRIEKGIIVEEPENDDENGGNGENGHGMDEMDEELYAPANLAERDDAETPAVPLPNEAAGVFDDDDDDWGFSALRGRKSRLFIGADDDDDDDVDSENEITLAPAENSTNTNANTNPTQNTSAQPEEEFPDDDDFADMNSSFVPRFEETQVEQHEEDDDDDHDEELAIMREMGM